MKQAIRKEKAAERRDNLLFRGSFLFRIPVG